MILNLYLDDLYGGEKLSLINIVLPQEKNCINKNIKSSSFPVIAAVDTYSSANCILRLELGCRYSDDGRFPFAARVWGIA